MKVLLLAALGAASLLPVAALARDSSGQSGTGHYEWQQVPQFGPRATGPLLKRIWVADMQRADCTCERMKPAAADCIRHMQGRTPSAHRAG